MSHPNLGAETIFGLDSKIALVTGGGTGIGLMIATGFADNGATVYIGSRRKNVVEATAGNYKGDRGRLIPLELDVTSKDSIQKAVDTISAAHGGKLDILVNNAGQVGPKTPFLSNPDAPERASIASLGKALFDAQSYEGWADVMNINASAMFFVSAAFLPLLDKASTESEPFSASIINITSISGSTKLAQNHFAYNASKAAANSITRMLSTELALVGAKVRVNAIAPGLFPSEMTDKEGDEFGAEETTKYSKAIVAVPGGRSGRAAEMAGPALLLASPAGRYTNGQVLVVDGGWQAVNPSI